MPILSQEGWTQPASPKGHESTSGSREKRKPSWYRPKRAPVDWAVTQSEESAAQWRPPVARDAIILAPLPITAGNTLHPRWPAAVIDPCVPEEWLTAPAALRRGG